MNKPSNFADSEERANWSAEQEHEFEQLMTRECPETDEWNKRSECCNAPVYVACGQDIRTTTNWHECSECGEACDLR